MRNYSDILYSEQNGVANVTINRPDSLNAALYFGSDEAREAAAAAKKSGGRRSARIGGDHDANLCNAMIEQ